MKPFFLSFATMLLFVGAYAQQVQVWNYTACTIEVTVIGYDGGSGCTPTSTTSPSSAVPINPGMSATFMDNNATDFEVSVYVPSATPPLTLNSNRVVSPGCLSMYAIAAPTNVTGAGCGSTNGFTVNSVAAASSFPFCTVEVTTY